MRPLIFQSYAMFIIRLVISLLRLAMMTEKFELFRLTFLHFLAS